MIDWTGHFSDARPVPYGSHNLMCTAKRESFVLVEETEQRKVFQISRHRVSKTTPLIRTLIIRIASYPALLEPSRKFVENSTKLTCLEITGYRVKYSTELWLLKL